MKKKNHKHNGFTCGITQKEIDALLDKKAAKPVAILDKKEILHFIDSVANRIHKEYYSWILETDDINKIDSENLPFYDSIDDAKYDFKSWKKIMGEKKDKARIIKVILESIE